MHAQNPEKTDLWVLEKLDLKYSSLEQIVHADSLSSQVYRVILSDGGSCILKLSYNTTRYRKEKHYLNALQGIIPVPRVLYTIDPEEGFHGALILEEVPGDLLKAETLTDACAFQLGEILARLHTVPIESYGDLSLPIGQRKGCTPLELMQNYFEGSLSECKHLVEQKLLSQCADYVERNLSVLLDAQGPCIVHRDYRPGNAIARDGTVRAIIDFEIAMGSFPEEDFAQMEMLAWHEAPHSRPAFLKGYASVRHLPEALEEILPLLRLLKALGAIGFTFERGTSASIHAHVYKKNLIFIEKFVTNNLKK